MKLHTVTRRSSRLAGTLLAAALLLSGCWDASAPQLVESGKARMAKKEYKAAAIDFKNALQKDANNVEARFLLGKSLLETGDVQGAWVELSKALEAGYNKDELVPVMAAALIFRGDTDKFIAEYGEVELSVPKRQAELKATLATAYGSKGKYEQARAAAETALQADPNNLVAQLALAQLAFIGGDKASAQAQVERAIKAHPESARPWVAKAELLQSNGADPVDGMAAYREALKAEGDNVAAHIGLINLLVSQRNLDAAAQQVVAMEKTQPAGSLTVRYYKALLAFEKRDLKTAFEQSQQLLKESPGNPRFLHLAGMVDYERGSYLQAIAHLGKALPATTSPAAVRVLMARAQLRAGDARKALSFVQPLLEDGALASRDAYAVAADAYAQMGDSESAKRMFAKVVQSNPEDARGRTALAMSDLASGQTDVGMSKLQAIADSTPEMDAEFAMLMTHLRSNQLDKALSVLDGMERKKSGQPGVPFFRGRIEQTRGNLDKARNLYEQALSRQASYGPAVAALALLDFNDGKPAVAVGRYEKLVAAEPKDVDARLGLIAARARASAKPADLRAQLEEAVKLFPESEPARITLVGTLLDQREVQAALKQAGEGLARFPDSPRLLLAQGLAELALGNHNQAAQAFSKAASLQPSAVEPLMYLADVELARNDLQASVAQLRKAVALKPEYMPAQIRLASLLVQVGKSDAALNLAQGLQKQFSNDPAGWAIEADLLAMKGNHGGAVAALKTALAKRPAEETVIKLHNAMRSAKVTAEADKLRDDWLNKYPDSPKFNTYLGDVAIAQQDFARAEKHLRAVVSAQPSNAVALNNLAWVLYRTGKPGALEISEKALALNPDSDAILDTTAEIIAAAGQFDKAIALQQRALERNPTLPILRLHLAQYLIKSGKTAEARAELKRLEALGAKFAAQDQVEKLLASLP